MLVGVTAATGGALSWFSGGKGARQEAHQLTSTLQLSLTDSAPDPPGDDDADVALGPGHEGSSSSVCTHKPT